LLTGKTFDGEKRERGKRGIIHQPITQSPHLLLSPNLPISLFSLSTENETATLTYDIDFNFAKT
jgi:hypothetical protein